ncbi:MAG: homocysteine S-methyltransferase family protein, partial [Phycisphaerae bacterium]|nr:homocysteine S-methyltransferase family protein [Phycisphaerae bacterium]
YVEAGADIVVANTFRTNPRTLNAAGCETDGPGLNHTAVNLARSAAIAGARPVVVAASVAPAEDCYHPERVPEEAQLRDEHGKMLEWLVAAGPDMIWIETMGTIREARAATEAAAGHLPLAVSFVLREDGALLSGEPLAEAVAAIEPFAPVAVGINCIPPTGITSLLPRLRKLTARPIAVYAHIGNRQPILGWSYSQEHVSPTEYADQARRWRDQGADIIGGCCGTTPAHIAAIAGI